MRSKHGVYRDAGPRMSERPADAVVVGAGIIGLSAALRLLERGWRVHLVAADPPPHTTSATAAALWYPYRAYPPDRVAAWGRRGYEVLAMQATASPESGVRLMAGVELLRTAAEWPTWGEAVPGLRRLDAAERPPSVADGFSCIAPVARMDVYLAWLTARVSALGGTAETRRLTSLADAAALAPLVVNCTGLGARTLVPDERVYPIRGQVVRVENPGLDRWTLDEEHPDGKIYIIPRGDDCILGGTAEPGEWSSEPDPDVAAAIVRRCASVEPRLADARVLGHRIGLRPARSAIRLEREMGAGGGTVIHCYGHGGAGVTLAWGCADDVVNLAGAPPAR